MLYILPYYPELVALRIELTFKFLQPKNHKHDVLQKLLNKTKTLNLSINQHKNFSILEMIRVKFRFKRLNIKVTALFNKKMLTT